MLVVMPDTKSPRSRAVTQPIVLADIGIAFNPRTRSYHNLPRTTVAQ